LHRQVIRHARHTTKNRENVYTISPINDDSITN
jgi:hypothetical protein